MRLNAERSPPSRSGPRDHRPQAQAPPHAQPAADPAPKGSPAGAVAVNENRRRTRSLPQAGHPSSVSTEAVIERRCSNGRSQARQMYSYVAIAQG